MFHLVNTCPLMGASVYESKIYKSMKNTLQHLKKTKEDWQRQYPRPVISIGWAQVPSQAQLEDEHTQQHRQTGGKDNKMKVTFIGLTRIHHRQGE